MSKLLAVAMSALLSAVFIMAAVAVVEVNWPLAIFCALVGVALGINAAWEAMAVE